MSDLVSQRFRLQKETVATIVQGGERDAVQIPAGAEIVVVDSIPETISEDHRRVDVHWEDKVLTMFLIDLQERGKRIQSVTEKRSGVAGKVPPEQ